MKTQDILKLLKNHSLLSEATLPQTEQLIRDYPWFAAGWTLYAKNLKIAGLSDYPAVLNRAALMSPDRKWLKTLMEGAGVADKNVQLADEYPIPDLPAGKTEKAAGVRSDNSRLIENFLEKGARFNTFSENEPGDQRVDLSERAVSFNDEMVTENFANILVKQKKFSEAIEAFQKLSLKYPEKSIYFAARIGEVKDLMNVNN